MPDDPHAAPPYKPLPLKAADVTLERRADGSMLMWSNHAVGVGPRTIPHLLADRAAAFPDRPFILQRQSGHGPWRQATYGEVKRGADGVAQWLLDRGLGASDCVMALSGPSIELGMLVFGCQTAGVPVSPISPACSLSADHTRLRHCFETVRPAVVFAQSGEAVAQAFETLRDLADDLIFVTVDQAAGSLAFAELHSATPTAAVEAAREALGPSTVAKYMFTSGSTGAPKAVIQTQGMFTGLIAALEGLKAAGPNLDDPPEVLDWGPWSHISSGNAILHASLWNGSLHYLDEGKPAPGQFEPTIRNFYEVSPRAFATVPAAYDMLAEAMERDLRLRASFFRNLRTMSSGGAMLSADVRARMQALAVAETGFRIPFTASYGSTEFQVAAQAHWITEAPGIIGVPIPGVVLKLAPEGERLELRVKSPMVTPGFLGDEARTRAAFDEEGFYRSGDAVRFLDPDRSEQGLVFDGRIVEEFKLSSATTVRVGSLRAELVAACGPYVLDMVIAGEGRGFVSALVWPSAGALEQHGPEQLAEMIRDRLAAFNAMAGGSSRWVRRFIVLTEPPSLDSGEATDKGYVNQRAVLRRRAEVVERLYADPPGAGVVVLEGGL